MYVLNKFVLLFYWGLNDMALLIKMKTSNKIPKLSTARKKNGKRRGRGKSSLDSNEEDEDEDTVATPAPSRRPGQTPRQTTVGKTQGNNKKGRRVRAVTFSSDEDDSDDDFFVADKGQAGSKGGLSLANISCYCSVSVLRFCLRTVRVYYYY